MHPLISVDKLQVFLGGRQVISDAAIEIASGEFIGLLGPNGAGKTTFMRSILGLVPVKSGNVQVNASIGYVPQRHDVAWEFPWNVRKTVLSGRTGFFKHESGVHVRVIRDRPGVVRIVGIQHNFVAAETFRKPTNHPARALLQVQVHRH